MVWAGRWRMFARLRKGEMMIVLGRVGQRVGVDVPRLLSQASCNHGDDATALGRKDGPAHCAPSSTCTRR